MKDQNPKPNTQESEPKKRKKRKFNASWEDDKLFGLNSYERMMDAELERLLDKD